MKTQRRHDLQQNELSLSLTRGMKFAKKYSNYIAWGVLLVAVIVFVAVFASRQQASKIQAVQSEFESVVGDVQMSPDDRLGRLVELASQTRDPFVAVQASLAVGNEYAGRIATGAGTLTETQIQEFSQKASDYYRQVIANHSDRRPQVAQAHLGLAKLAENKGDFDSAANSYRESIKASPSNHPVGKFAEAGLAGLPTVQAAVPMATTMPATQPADEATTAPANEATTAPATNPS